MPRLCHAPIYVALLALLAACGGGTKEEVPSKDTFECTLEGARWLVRFTEGEARLLTPDGNRINLYQVASGSGFRYTNGIVELRGRGMEMTITQDAFTRELRGCKPVMVPKEEPSRFPWLAPPPQR